MKTKEYQPRIYRSICRGQGLVNFNVVMGESDLMIRAERDLRNEAYEILGSLRRDIESYIGMDRSFLTSLEPVLVPGAAPDIVRSMARAGTEFGVGPMAAVAGAIAEKIARELARFSRNVIVENGGDIFMISDQPMTSAVFTGGSPLSMKLGIMFKPGFEGMSICTSSGTVGHSLSFGKADAVSVICHDGSMADSAATAICNMVKGYNDLKQAIDFARKHEQIDGLTIIIGSEIAVFGEKIELVDLGV